MRVNRSELKHSISDVSKVIRHMRRSRDLSLTAFADVVSASAMLLDVVEQADTPQGAKLCAMLPIHEVNALVDCLEEISGQSFVDMYAAAAQEDVSAGDADEVTVYLPVTVSVDRTMDVIDRIIMLAPQGWEHEQQHVLCGGVLNARFMIQLLYTHYAQQGMMEEANACIDRFTALLETRQ